MNIPPHDLNALALNAQKDIDRAQAQREAMGQRGGRRVPWLRGVVGLLVAGLFLSTLGDHRTRRYWLGVSDQEQTTEMSAAMAAAKLAVERSHATTGEWPDRVPLAALAALVQLENPGPNFRLLARTDQWELTMSAAGEVKRTRP